MLIDQIFKEFVNQVLKKKIFFFFIAAIIANFNLYLFINYINIFNFNKKKNTVN